MQATHNIMLGKVKIETMPFYASKHIAKRAHL